MPDWEAAEREFRSSLSQLDTYANCSFQWYLDKVGNLPRREAAWFFQGSAEHEAIEQWELSGRKIDAVAAFNQSYIRMAGEAAQRSPDLDTWLRGGRKSTKKDVEDRFREGAAQVADYVESALAAPWEIYTLPDGTKALELMFSVQLGGCTVRGSIDSVRVENGVLRVVDYKSGAKVKSNRQLGLYAVAARTQYGLDINWGEYWMLKHRKTNGSVDLRKYTKAYFDAQFRMMRTGVQQKVFIPNPGDHCFTCPFKDACPEYG
jgi:CRISPR/Cas system-associated exonuclease Cas4 (RecB family)